MHKKGAWKITSTGEFSGVRREGTLLPERGRRDLVEDNRVHDLAGYSKPVRDGILAVCVPRNETETALQDLPGRRGLAVRTLLPQGLPVLTPMVVLVADLQEAEKICAELPAAEYFELVNQIRATTGGIVRKYYGTEGYHAGEGMVYYFFPRVDSNYLFDAAVCALELKSAIACLSKEWQLRKNWLNGLYLNAGLSEGEEWLGAFQTSSRLEFVALGETVHASACLSRLARFGQIWVAKKLMSKLPAGLRECIEFGIERIGPGGSPVMTPSSYSRVGDLLEAGATHDAGLQAIAGLAVTEIRSIAARHRL